VKELNLFSNKAVTSFKNKTAIQMSPGQRGYVMFYNINGAGVNTARGNE